MRRFSDLFFSACLLFVYAAATPVASSSKVSTSDSTDGTPSIMPYIALRNLTGDQEPDDFYGDERASAAYGYCALSHTPVPFTSTKPFRSLARNGYFYVPDTTIDIRVIRQLERDLFWRELVRYE